MTSQLLDSMGLGNIDFGYIIIALASLVVIIFICLIVVLCKLGKLSKKYKQFLVGKDGKSLELEIKRVFEDNLFLKEHEEHNRKEIRRINKNLEITFQKVGLVKYDAFKEMGGMLSYSLALLNDRNDGFILNSVHSSDGCYSYTKEIKNGECAISLSEDEKNALNKALGNNRK